ncbi:MAG TPA: hypothetical protein VG722_09905, partial [Tepidisphaeraceae bacterium]|nr:hypothetical protein [Tepidisphaeraceae bacterium]
REDPGELHDILREKPQLVAKLKQKLAGWFKRVGAKFPRDNPKYAHDLTLPIVRVPSSEKRLSHPSTRP